MSLCIYCGADVRGLQAVCLQAGEQLAGGWQAVGKLTGNAWRGLCAAGEQQASSWQEAVERLASGCRKTSELHAVFACDSNILGSKRCSAKKSTSKKVHGEPSSSRN